MRFDFNDIFDRIPDLNENDPRFRMLEFLDTIRSFCGKVFFFGMILFIVLPSGQAAWECLGGAVVAFIIWISVMKFFATLIPKDVIDEMFEDIIRELEEEKDDEQEKDDNDEGRQRSQPL